MKKNLIEKISSAKSGRSESVFFVVKSVYEPEPSVDIVSPIFPNKEDAEEFFAEYNVTPEFAEEITVYLQEYELNPENLCYVEGFEDCDEEELSEILKEIIYADWGHILDVDEKDFYYVFENIRGAVLVFWSWQTYVGYARKCIEIRDAWFDETEEITIKRDAVFKTQCDIIITAEESAELSVEDRRRLLEQRLLEEGDWRWQNNAQKRIDEYMEKYEEEA